MLPIHKPELHQLKTDEQVLDFMFSHPMADMVESELLPPPPQQQQQQEGENDQQQGDATNKKKLTPIQTLETLQSESDALGIDTDELKQIKLKELTAIYLSEPTIQAKEDGNNNNDTKNETNNTKDDNDISNNDDNTDNNNNKTSVKLPQFHQANALFTSIINKYPSYPSAYNNRAQLYQLLALYLSQYPQYFTQLTGTVLPPTATYTMNEIDAETNEKKVILSPQLEQIILKKIKFTQLQALSDLNQSIQLCYRLYPLFSPDHSHELLQLQEKEEKEWETLEAEFNKQKQQQQQQPQDGTSDNNETTFVKPPSKLIVPRVLIQSLSQRAILHKLRGNELQSFQDFTQAAALGSTMAQEELASMNTFEKLNRQTVFAMMKQQALGLNENATVMQQQGVEP